MVKSAPDAHAVKRIGLLGGTFDPVHSGHLLIAQACVDQLQLDEMVFMPTAVPPHKQGRWILDAEHRYQLLQLALQGHAQMGVSRWEIDRGGVSYTVDTLRHLHELHTQMECYLILGSDSFHALDTWKSVDEIRQLARLAVVERPGSAVTEVSDDVVFIQMDPVLIASSDIRRRCTDGLSLKDLVPEGVATYISEHALYQVAPPEVAS